MRPPTTLSPVSATGEVDRLLKEVEARMVNVVRGDSVSEDEIAAVSVSAAIYHLESGGQRFRARLALGAGTALGMAPRDAVAIASAVELLHNASLVHDDLQDGETERRGLPTVARVYGDSIALCVGDLCLSSAYAALAQFENPSLVPKLLKLMHKRTAAVIRGQCAEFATGDAISQVTDYVKIVREKSGVLLSLPLELALLGSGRAEWLGNARSAAENFGIAYQIVDDIQDYERDSANDRARPCLNILDVLMRGGHSENSIRVATECAMWHFDLCARDAASLPHGSGNNLLALIESLRNQL